MKEKMKEELRWSEKMRKKKENNFNLKYLS